jgi:hypothetical protein
VLGFEPVHTADVEANMNHHVIARLSIGHKTEAPLALDPAELHAARTQRAQLPNFQDLTWYREAHGGPPAANTALEFHRKL